MRHEKLPLRRQTIRQTLRVNNQSLGDVLAKLEAAGQIIRTDRGWCAA
jgi:hypothetical protein